MKRLEYTDFEPFKGATFEFTNISSPSKDMTSLVLKDVSLHILHERDIRTRNSSDKYRAEPFSLFFEGDHEPYLQQGTYEISHPDLSAPLQIFITCLGPTESGKGFEYEAVFS